MNVNFSVPQIEDQHQPDVQVGGYPQGAVPLQTYSTLTYALITVIWSPSQPWESFLFQFFFQSFPSKMAEMPICFFHKKQNLFIYFRHVFPWQKYYDIIIEFELMYSQIWQHYIVFYLSVTLIYCRPLVMNVTSIVQTFHLY